MGPLIVFDKSALQSFSMDESVWFDAFFMGNMTPLFYVEVLADLEKSVKAGKTPEEVVGMLAHKTPSHAVPNIHHQTLVLGELAGNPVGMSGRPLVAGGTPKRTPDGNITVHFENFPEAAALNRWHNYEFTEIERGAAKKWRTALMQQDSDMLIAKLKNIVPANHKFSNLEELKAFIDKFCDGTYRQLLELAMDVLDVPLIGRPKIIKRWEEMNKPPLSMFAPYATHVFKVDLLYYLGIDRGFISGVRASNKADMAYLYYLPFCMVFVSGDKLHSRTVPLFLQSDQSYISASDLKLTLQELDAYYTALPDAIKERGVMQFVGYPPSHMNNIVTELWDKHLRPDWRDIAKEQEAQRLNPEGDGMPAQGSLPKILKEVDESMPLTQDELPQSMDEVASVVMHRKMPVHKGRWRMVSEEVARSGKDKSGLEESNDTD